jgi:hypothetical protein
MAQFPIRGLRGERAAEAGKHTCNSFWICTPQLDPFT